MRFPAPAACFIRSVAAQASEREVRCPRLADHQERLRPAQPATGTAVGRAATPDLGRVALRFPRNRHARCDTEPGAAVDSRGGPLRARVVGVCSATGMVPKVLRRGRVPSQPVGSADVRQPRSWCHCLGCWDGCVCARWGLDTGQRRLTTAGACGTAMQLLPIKCCRWSTQPCTLSKHTRGQRSRSICSSWSLGHGQHSSRSSLLAARSWSSWIFAWILLLFC